MKGESMNNNFGERIVEVRKEFRLSQEALAEQVGVSRQAISKWECNEAVPDLKNLITLATIFDMTVDDLMNGKEVPKSVNSAPIRIDLRKKALYHVSIGVLVYVLGIISIVISPFQEEFATIIFMIFFICSTILVIRAVVLDEKYKKLNHLKSDKNTSTQMIKEAKSRRGSFVVAVSLVTTALYLYIGISNNHWSPTWLIFVIIPASHYLYNAFAFKK